MTEVPLIKSVQAFSWRQLDSISVTVLLKVVKTEHQIKLLCGAEEI